MNRDGCLALVGLRALESLGIRSVVHGFSDMGVESFGSFREFRPVADKADAFVVSADVFVSNIDYFMPRKSKTVIVGGDLGREESAFTSQMIFPDSDEAEINAVLKKLISSLGEEEIVPGELSQREKEVLKLIASGKINKEIADDLCISVNTVITHRKNLSAKLGIKSASGLSLYALMNGII